VCECVYVCIENVFKSGEWNVFFVSPLFYFFSKKMKFWTLSKSQKRRSAAAQNIRKTKEKNVDEEDPLRGHDGDDDFR